MKALALMVIAMLSGCASIAPTNWGVEEGKVWCNSRYLDMVKELDSPAFTAPGYDEKHQVTLYDVSVNGYPYALAAALALQEGDDGGHTYVGEPLLRRYGKPLEQGPQPAGFYAVTFIRDTDDPSRPEIVVAFSGTNDSRDWFRHNLSFSPEQFAPARAYVKQAAAAFPQRSRLVVAGYSLGGGLAAHVTLHDETRALVQEAWLLNPSPRDGVDTEPDPRIWMAAVSGEILNVIRFGAGSAPRHQRSKRFRLIRSSSIHRHFRWVLTQQMLHIADLAEFVRSGRTLDTTPALDVLKRSNAPACSPEYADMIAREREAHTQARIAPPTGAVPGNTVEDR